MKKTYITMLYLVSCGINRIVPDKDKISNIDVEELFDLSSSHMLEVLVGTSLKRCGMTLPEMWTQKLSKSTRKAILFDDESKKLFDFMEQNGIWYLPMKGTVLQKYYPEIGMRQMSDIDVLFDKNFSDDIRKFMESQGYKTERIGTGVHDNYYKAPVYNFEMHRHLFDSATQPKFGDYYENLKTRLILCDNYSFRYRFTVEDFYIYMLAHAYKHYTGGGTGIRTLLDFYAYLISEEKNMDFEYICKECEILGLDEFERQSRFLCRKVFDSKMLDDFDELENFLSYNESEMLRYYLSSGTYGTYERLVTNKIKEYQTKTGTGSKFRYIWGRVFPDIETYKTDFPFFYKHKWLLPIGWLYRLLRMMFSSKRRSAVWKEVKIIKKTSSK